MSITGISGGVGRWGSRCGKTSPPVMKAWEIRDAWSILEKYFPLP